MPEKDVFVNQAYLSVTESAANTLTFNKLETAISIHEKVGWVIARIDYDFDLVIADFNTAGARINFGLSTSDVFTTPDLDISAVIDFNNVTRRDIGTPANAFFIHKPIIKDFSNLPGGGILIPPNPLFMWAMGASLTNPITLRARMFYVTKVLKLEDFWELVELRRMIGT